MPDLVVVTLNPNLTAIVAAAAMPACRHAADQIADVAKANAPVDTGAYQKGIGAELRPGGAAVVTKDQKSSWIEFGIPGRGIPARWTLRNAAEQAGYKLKGT